MPGVDLNLVLPEVSNNLATVVSRAATALSAIEDDLSALVNPSEIAINAALSAGGYSLTDVRDLQMIAGNPPGTPGSLYYHTDGEFYMRTSTTAVKVTTNGTLNISGTGGFTGDYGSGPETASYDNASGEFRFTEDTGVYADLVLDDLVLMGASGSTRYTTAAAMTSARQFHFASLPTSGVTLLTYDAGDSTVGDNNENRLTSTLRVTNLDLAGTIEFGDEQLVELENITSPGHAESVDQVDRVTRGVTAAGVPYWSGTSVGQHLYVDLVVPPGAELMYVHLFVDAASGMHTTSPLTLYARGSTPGAAATLTTVPGANSWRASGGTGEALFTLSTPSETGGYSAYRLRIEVSSTSAQMYALKITYRWVG